MNDVVLTNAQLQALQWIAKAMGYKLDELGHPYRHVDTHQEAEGVHTRSIFDFDPYNDPADAMRVQLHFGLSLEIEYDVVMVRDGCGPILGIHQVEDVSPEGKLRASCLALVEAAAKQIAKRERARATGQDEIL